MIDVLLRFPSRDVAAQIGAAMGYTTLGEDGEWKTTEATLTLAVCVIGQHYTGNPPVGDGKWWVMVRSLIDIPVPDSILQFVVPRDPNNSAIPGNIWA